MAVRHAQQPAICGGAVAQYLGRRLEEPGRGGLIAALDAVAHHPEAELAYRACVVVGRRSPPERAAPELVAEQHVAGRSSSPLHEAEQQRQKNLRARGAQPWNMALAVGTTHERVER